VTFKVQSNNNQLPEDYRSLCLPSGELYLMGGSISKISINYVFKFNYYTNTFERQQSCMLKEREQFGLIHLLNQLFVVGGYSDKDQATLRECECFDLLE